MKPTPPEVKKRARSEGALGEMVSFAESDLLFSGRGKPSVYDGLLSKLAEATERWIEAGRKGNRPMLKFGVVSCRTSVGVRARKMALRVSFAEHANELYVRCDGRVENSLNETRRATIRTIMGRGVPMTYLQITNQIRVAGDETVEAADVDILCAQMMREGALVKQDGGLYRLAPKKATA